MNEAELRIYGENIRNYNYVQSLIDKIKEKEKIDIKDIADLGRYFDMQNKIVNSNIELSR